MAGDWIKMRNNLWDDPRVSRICDLTDSSEASVVGALYWLWSSADEHTEDGYMHGLSVTGIDRKTGVKGFGNALLTVGWIADADEGITIVRFDEHNGASAKRRCSDAQRKANFRNLSASDADILQTSEGQNAPTCGAREEKRRKDKNKAASSPTYLPENFSISESVRAWAERNGHSSLDVHLANFVDTAKARGYKYIDWDAAFRKAIAGNWAKVAAAASRAKQVVL